VCVNWFCYVCGGVREIGPSFFEFWKLKIQSYIPVKEKDKKMINIGDIVQLKEPHAQYGMIVLAKRKMFASDIHAYTVKYPNGETVEYDETQLVKL